MQAESVYVPAIKTQLGTNQITRVVETTTTTQNITGTSPQVTSASKKTLEGVTSNQPSSFTTTNDATFKKDPATKQDAESAAK